MLLEDKKWQNLMRVNAHPAITINNVTYEGDLDGKDVANAICASFKERPSVCQDGLYIELAQVAKGEIDPIKIRNYGFVGKLLMSIVLIGLVNLCLVFVHKKVRGDADKNEIQMEVNQAVSQYFALRGDEIPSHR